MDAVEPGRAGGLRADWGESDDRASQAPEAYDYGIVRGTLFTDEGSRLFLKVRDRVHDLAVATGAIRMREAIGGLRGDRWELMASIDRMVEIGELIEIAPGRFDGLFRIFTLPT